MYKSRVPISLTADNRNHKKKPLNVHICICKLNACIPLYYIHTYYITRTIAAPNPTNPSTICIASQNLQQKKTKKKKKNVNKFELRPKAAVKDEEERLPAGEMLLPLATATATTATIKINKHLTSKTKTIIPTTAIATTTTTTSTRTSTNINNATTITTNLKRTATLPKSISSRFLNIPIYNNTHLTVHNNANNNNIFRNKTYSNMNTNNINTINSSSPSPSPSLSSTTTTTITSTTSSPSLSPTLSLPSLSLLSTTLFSTLTTKTPLAPTIVPEDCSAENNSVTVAWHAPAHSFVDGYVLELDDGSGGEFREVYCGKETICTVDGLHFNSMYNARVKAFNNAGEGEYSELIGLQTAEVAWFTFDPILSGGAGSGLVFSNNNATVSVEGWEHRVALGSVGFSRGIHYWEFTVDKYTMDTDPAFGVARIDVNRNKMLGKDEKSFAMYIDGQRSWFQHNSVHERRVEGGITTGSTIGVLLDLERHTLSFLVNEMPQGSVAFRDLYGVFYPAVSINRGVTLTLHTALVAPKMDYF
ncbi:unnamed protein product [Ceratitis capitata]|uniref:(Mediterranean fruit fly) hypothetical protein n=1 Tax=Ceratitis capitata TaxID=7213 RepID=A0A811UKZ3_CERCA|nr:unnamed protein product [Ceratitis capitata]